MYHLGRALESDPGDANAHSNMGHVTLMMGQPERALGHYREALRLNPELVNAVRGLDALYRDNPGLRLE